MPRAAPPRLPAAVEVVIVGGGIVGVSAAWHLAERGMSVLLCEKGEIGQEQSGRNWGWCRNTLRSPAEIPLMQQSLSDWRSAEVFGGLATGFRTTGILYFTGRTRGDRQAYESWLASVRGFGLDSRMATREEVGALVPGCVELPGKGALYTASDGCAEPGLAAPAIAAAAAARGAIIRSNCAVRSVEQGAGRLCAVVTEHGAVRCDAAIVAGGAWSRLFAGNLGLDLPALNVMGSVMRTAPLAGGPGVSVAGRRFGWRKRADGGFVLSQADATIFDIVPDSFRLLNAFRPMIGTGLRQLRLRVGRSFWRELTTPRHWQADQVSPFERMRLAAPQPSKRVLREALLRAGEAMPVFREAEIVESWGGLIDVTPDALPIIGPSARLPGLHYATGFSGHGFGLGPGGGRLISDLVQGRAPVVDAAAFRPARFGL